VIRRAALALVLLGLAACSGSGEAAGDSSDPYAGLDPQIQAWRTSLEASHPACAAKVEGKGCEAFAVTCKGARDISPDEQAKGVQAKIVAAMTFTGRRPDGSSGDPGSAFAEFVKTGGQWTRTEAKPVNLTSCAPA
jgi:hypothetical protein